MIQADQYNKKLSKAHLLNSWDLSPLLYGSSQVTHSPHIVPESQHAVTRQVGEAPAHANNHVFTLTRALPPRQQDTNDLVQTRVPVQDGDNLPIRQQRVFLARDDEAIFLPATHGFEPR